MQASTGQVGTDYEFYQRNSVKSCHPERSERGAQRSVHARRAGGTPVVSFPMGREMLRCAQHDILIVKTHYRPVLTCLQHFSVVNQPAPNMRVSISATMAGFFSPSISTVFWTFSKIRPGPCSSTAFNTARLRMRDPAFTGVIKRTRSSP